MTQPTLNLFSPPPAQQHSATSRSAAAEIKPNALSLRKQVLKFLRDRGAQGATDEEMQLGLQMNPSTQRPRRVELMKAGLVTGATGMTRKTTSGRDAVVWRAL